MSISTFFPSPSFSPFPPNGKQCRSWNFPPSFLSLMRSVACTTNLSVMPPSRPSFQLSSFPSHCSIRLLPPPIPTFDLSSASEKSGLLPPARARTESMLNRGSETIRDMSSKAGKTITGPEEEEDGIEDEDEDEEDGAARAEECAEELDVDDDVDEKEGGFCLTLTLMPMIVRLCICCWKKIGGGSTTTVVVLPGEGSCRCSSRVYHPTWKYE